MATIVLAFGRAGGLKHVDLFYMTTGGLSATDSAGYIMYILVVSLFLLFSLFVGRRAACHTLCWMAPFMIIGSKIKNGLKYPSLHLEAKPDACVSCQLCNRKCTMGLDVNQMVLQGKMENNECILCGECVDTCAKKAIRYAFAYQRSEGESR
jgi:NAD-dependent dihydropyrimidine dehydrogenase PreA subunit